MEPKVIRSLYILPRSKNNNIIVGITRIRACERNEKNISVHRLFLYGFRRKVE